MIVNKAISVISHCDIEGNIKPLKFKIVEDDMNFAIPVEHINRKIIRNINDKLTIIYTCISVIHEVKRNYEIHYIINECKWVLVKF